MIPTPSIQIIIVNYNSDKHLHDCLNSCNQHGEIIVVDNNSTDNSLKKAQEKNNQDITIKKLKKNIGFAKACNVGSKNSNADYLLFLNPDCIVENETVKVLQSILENTTNAGMVGGLLLNPDGTEQIGGRRTIPTPGLAFARAFGLSKLFPSRFPDFELHKEPLPNKPIKVDAITGACMMVKREDFEAIGGWDEAYFLHCEDLDICMRMRTYGKDILFVPDARVVHQKGACSKTRPIFVEWHKHKGMVRFYKTHFRKKYTIFFWWTVIIGIWLRFSIITIRLGIFSSK